MAYVEGFVLAVKTDRREDYRRMADEVGRVFKEHGALSIVECWADDVPEGKVTSFPMAVKCAPDESVVFSWIVWPSKEARDAGNDKVMNDPHMQGPQDDTIMDPSRMIFGGFVPIVEL